MAEKVEKTPIRKEEKVLNDVIVKGYLKAKEIVEAKDKNQKPYIRGTLTVQIGDNKSVDVSFYEPKFRADGSESKLYTSAQKLTEYVSIADLIETKKADNEAEAKKMCDRVSINGSINPNEYFNTENVLVSRPKIEGKFFHKATDKSPIQEKEFGVNFDVELYFLSIKPEYENKIETGRALVEAVVFPQNINFGRVGVVNFVVDEGAAGYLLDHYVKNASGNVWGEFRITEQAPKEEKKGFAGTTSKVESGGVTFEWVITDGEADQYEEGSKKDFDKDLVKKALEERLVDLEKAKAEKGSKDTKKSGFGSKPNNNVSEKTKENIANKFDDEDY